MTITRRITLHDGPDGPFESMAVVDTAAAGAQPGILLFPNVLGTKEADFAYAEKVAALGYAVLVADVYGQGKRTTRADTNPALYMNALNADRAVLRDRVNAAHDVLKGLAEVDLPARPRSASASAANASSIWPAAARTSQAASASMASMMPRPSPMPRSAPGC
tara:strand:- start:8958 stop:9446 length:489 start_codon:yes stop_codon:yes gene_type:complete